MSGPGTGLPRFVDEVGRKADDSVPLLARVGHVAKGIVYLSLGFLATRVALLGRGRLPDKQSALMHIPTLPLGRAVLLVVALGLPAYMIWRLIEAAKPNHRLHGFKGVATRAAYAVSGIAHGLLAFAAIQLLLSGRAGDDGHSPRPWVARAFAQPFGRWLVGAIALGLMGYGAARFFSGVTSKFKDKLMRVPAWALWLGRIGLAAKGIVWATIGYSLLRAVRDVRPGKASDMDGALLWIRHAGKPWMLTVVALGLTCYGAYLLLVESRWRRFERASDS